jgi:hypothetical protein
MRRPLAVLLLAVLAASGCASHPDGAYFPAPHGSDTRVVSHTLYRAAVAEALSRPAYLAAVAEEGGTGVARAFADLLAALRRREVYRHLSNAADRLDTAGRALHDIVVGKV